MNTEVMHTPGPWEVRTQTYDKDIIPGDTHYVAVITRTNDTSDLGHLLMVNGDYHVCKFNPTKDAAAARKMANDATLIAAAPDLFEALDLARRYMKLCLGSSFWDGPNPHPIIDAALAKARGEANG
ncbi:hypothetical protein [Brucella anthropi]|uniref:hypothetical protein n=1 Tax=Brucella anthropi TaxID=529 RepID=UPI00320AFBD5